MTCDSSDIFTAFSPHFTPYSRADPDTFKMTVSTFNTRWFQVDPPLPINHTHHNGVMNLSPLSNRVYLVRP